MTPPPAPGWFISDCLPSSAGAAVIAPAPLPLVIVYTRGDLPVVYAVIVAGAALLPAFWRFGTGPSAAACSWRSSCMAVPARSGCCVACRRSVRSPAASLWHAPALSTSIALYVALFILIGGRAGHHDPRPHDTAQCPGRPLPCHRRPGRAADDKPQLAKCAAGTADECAVHPKRGVAASQGSGRTFPGRARSARSCSAR